MSTKNFIITPPKTSTTKKIGTGVGYIIMGLLSIFVISFGIGAGGVGAALITDLLGRGWLLVYVAGALALSGSFFAVIKKIWEKNNG